MTYEEQKGFCQLNDKGEPKGIKDSKICDYVKEHHPLFVLGGSIYTYQSGAYFLDENEARVCKIIKDMIPECMYNVYNLKRVIKLFLMDIDLIRHFEDLNNFPDNWVCFRDCMFDVITGEKIAHKPEYLCINQIPHNAPDMNDTGGGEVFEKYLAETMGADDRKTILEYLGLCLTKNNSFQKFVILTGARGTGKSVLLRLFGAIIGNDNISAVPLQNISEKFHAIQMLGKLLNSCGDLPGQALQAVDKIKQITGGDMIIDSYKGKDCVCFTPYCKLLFSANTVPISLDEKSNAFFERVIIVRMDHPAKKPDRNLDAKLRTEIPYILRICLLALRELYENGSLYESELCRESVAQLYRDSDSVKAFLFAHTKKAIGEKIKPCDLYSKYKTFCEDEERTALSRNSFYRNIAGKNITKKVVHGSEYFSDIGWKREGESPLENQPSDAEFQPCDGLQIPFDV